ncbi:MAG: hypothetical protein K2O00_03675 [Muribaculaceae bacterium]|nr:hypothetical protein [Muribaculaceae bacterium]
MIERDHILLGRVKEWLKAARYIDEHIDKFSSDDITAQYRLVRNMFKSGAEQLSDEQIQKIQLVLYEESWNITDEFGANLRSFSGKIGKIIEARESFGRLVREQEKPEQHQHEVKHDKPADKHEEKTTGKTEEKPKEKPVPPPHPEKRTIKRDGNLWEGMFLNGQPVERGKITYSDGMIYEGEWSDYGPDGFGFLRHSDKTMWSLYCKFLRGRPTGNLTFAWSNGDKFEAEKYIPGASYPQMLRNTTGVYTFKKNGYKEHGVFANGKWVSFEKKPEPRTVTRMFTPAQLAITIISIAVGIISCITAISI